MFGYYNFINKINLKKLEKEYNQPNYRKLFSKNCDELYLFGNGYSLNNFNFGNIVNKDCFVCNEFYMLDIFDSFVLKNNLLYFSMDAIKSYKNISKKLNLTLEDTLSIFIDPIISKNYILVTNISLFPYIKGLSINSKLIYDKFYLQDLLKNYKRDIIKMVNNIKIQHTPQVMILTAILEGYKRINLVGLEHNYVKDILNKDDVCGTHFYAEDYQDVLELNIGKNLPRDAYKVKLSDLFQSNSIVFKTYEQLADLAKEMGVEIIDHSNGSLFMFQDYSLWDLVEEKNRN